MQQRIEFFFDFSSAYSYIALAEIERMLTPKDCTILWRPISLGVIFKANNHQPHSFDSPKGRYIKQDVERCAAQLGLPFNWPTPFPFNSIPAARLFYAIAEKDTEQAILYTKTAFKAAMGEGQDLSNTEVLHSLVASLELDAAELLREIQQDKVKQQVRHATEEAQQASIFGTPSFLMNGELFWGADRLTALTRRLAQLTG